MNVNNMKKLYRDIGTLSEFSSTSLGVTRLPYTVDNQKAIDYLKGVMEEIGLRVEVDQVGNVLGTMKGTDNKGAIYIGSHYDSVINGGKYDGVLGIVTGIEMIRRMKESGYEPKHDFVVLATNDEEGVRFGNGYFGTRAILGDVLQEELHQFCDVNNISIHQALSDAGFCPEAIKSAKRDISKVKALLEVHIEQGPILDRNDIHIGVVEGIVGIKRYIFNIKGEANHAGTTPMDMRKDSLYCASQIISMVKHIVTEEVEDTVATVGYLNVKPNVINVVAGEVEFGIDIRSRKVQNIDKVYNRLMEKADDLIEQYGVQFQVEQKLSINPIRLDEQLIGTIQDSCEHLGISHMQMYSGAGHDSLVWASHVPTGMIFIPSKDGISHHPDEYSTEESIEIAMKIAYETLMRLDKR